MLIVVVVVHLSFRALNEMWKCQNMLRHHVKDLLDLVKQPKVSFFLSQLFHFGYSFSDFSILYVVLLLEHS